jgi:hypothetical protein
LEFDKADPDPDVAWWTKDVTAGSAAWSPGLCILGTSEALKRIARGAKQPRVLGTQGDAYPDRGCRFPNLRTPPGCGFQWDAKLPGCVLRTTRGYRL